MTDTTNNQPLHVTTEERPHPALQKLARACIALARLRRDERHGQSHQPIAASAVGDEPEACHG